MKEQINKIKRSTIIGAILRYRFRLKFEKASGMNLFWGCFSTWHQAEQEIPPTKPKSYNNNAAAGMYVERAKSIHYNDYPMLFWLTKLHSELNDKNWRIFDYGGHIGVSFYAYDSLLPLNKSSLWKIYDVPAVLEQGQKLAQERNENRLVFTSNTKDMADCEVLFVSGSAQYAPDFFKDLANCQLPDHVLLTRVSELPHI